MEKSKATHASIIRTCGVSTRNEIALITGSLAIAIAYRHRASVKSFTHNGYTLSVAALASWRDAIGSGLFSRVIEACSSDIKVDNRGTFKDCCVDQAMSYTTPKTHSHPTAALDRCKANTMMMIAATAMGHELYSVQPSSTDNDNMDCYGDIHHAKDMQRKLQKSKLTTDHVIKLVDVDYYIDMPSLMHSNDLMLYTFVPEYVAGNMADGTFTMDDANNVISVVNGGATYTHPLWHYDLDHVVVDHWYGSSIFLVEQKIITEHRRVIYLQHLRTTYGPFGWFVPGERLHRKVVSHGQFNHMRVVKSSIVDNKQKNVMYNSFGLPHLHNSCQITDQTLSSASIRVAMTPKPQISDVERIVRNDNVDHPVSAATILFTVLTGKTPIEVLRMKQPITPTSESKQLTPTEKLHYQTLGPLVTEDGNPSIRVLHPALIAGVVSPLRSHNNDQACISARVLDVTNQVTTYPTMYWVYLREFVKLCVPEYLAHTFVPYDYDQQYATLKRQSQRGFLSSVSHVLYHDDRWYVKSFQKAEAYSKVAAPRNISTLPAEHNARLGQFIGPLADHMKTLHWYAFGKHPRKLSRLMHIKFSEASTLVPTDVDKNDGSMGYIHQMLNNSILYRAYAPEHHSALKRLNVKEQYAKGTTNTGVHYVAENNTLSGSAITTFRNGNSNAFSNYCALRACNDATTSWAKLGMYGGDDGITADIDPKHLAATFAKMGMSIKAKSQPAGLPIDFLGRIYLDLTTCSHSIIDPMRHAVKVHITTQPSVVPDNVVLWQKAIAYMVTDSELPIISNWAKMIMRVIPRPTDAVFGKWQNTGRTDANYWSQFENPYDQDYSQDLARDVMCQSMGITGAEVDILCQSLDDISTPEQLMSYASIVERQVVVTVPVALAGELMVTDAPPRSHQSKVAKNARAVPNPMPTKAQVVSSRSIQKNIEGKNGAPRPPYKLTRQLCRYVVGGTICPFVECKYSHDLVSDPQNIRHDPKPFSFSTAPQRPKTSPNPSSCLVATPSNSRLPIAEATVAYVERQSGRPATAKTRSLLSSNRISVPQKSGLSVKPRRSGPMTKELFGNFIVRKLTPAFSWAWSRIPDCVLKSAFIGWSGAMEEIAHIGIAAVLAEMRVPWHVSLCTTHSLVAAFELYHHTRCGAIAHWLDYPLHLIGHLLLGLGSSYDPATTVLIHGCVNFIYTMDPDVRVAVTA